MALSEFSSNILETCDVRLQKIVVAAAEVFPLLVIEGHRDKEQQNSMKRIGHSQLSWPNSKHNKTPSLAVDLVPRPVDWNNIKQFILMAGFVLGIAYSMEIKLRWGGDWDGDWNMKNQGFYDYGHFELI